MSEETDTMSPKLRSLIAKRGAIFARLNSIHDMAKKIPVQSVETRSMTEFLASSSSVKEMRQDFMKVCDDFNELSLEEDANFIPNYSSWLAFETLYSFIQQTRSDILQKRLDSVNQDNRNVHVQSAVRIKLPPIEIQCFDGTPNMWPLFLEAFNTNIHNNTSLHDSQKVQYLVSKLKGKALSLVSGAVCNAENYKSIYDAMVKKYNDKRSLGDAYLNTILNLQYDKNKNESFSQFVDTLASSESALKQLNIDDLSGFILTHVILKKLDKDIVHSFEQSVREKDMIGFSELLEYLQHQCKVRERTSACTSSQIVNASNKCEKKGSKSFTMHSESHTFAVSANNSVKKCWCCGSTAHVALTTCSKFKNLDTRSRFRLIKKNTACIGCLDNRHTVTACCENIKCDLCDKNHNTLLHFGNRVDSTTTALTVSPAGPLQQDESSSSITMHTHRSNVGDKGTVVLSTARVFAMLGDGNQAVVRCLIDSASQNHLISKQCCEKLGLKIQKAGRSVLRTLGSVNTSVLGKVSLKIKSRFSEEYYVIELLVVSNIIDRMPVAMVDTSKMEFLSGLQLADEYWHQPSEVEVILGAQLFPYLILNGRINHKNNSCNDTPSAVQTTLGYIVMGNAPVVSSTFQEAYTFGPITTDDNLQESLTKFWEIESVPNQIPPSDAELQCESVYASETIRVEDGHYIVPLIFNENPLVLGKSHSSAKRRLLALERRMESHKELRSAYNSVFEDYLSKGYLSEIEYSQQCIDSGYFIPHHAVVKPEKSSTKTRVVLDASCRTDNGVSLNDILHTGPNLQSSLFDLLLNFRLFPVALSADIQQMYLRISVKEQDRQYQKILFRFSETEPIRAFQFNSVAFGLRCSPFLALRTVKQLAQDEKDRFPIASQVASSDLYMDDLTTSVMSAADGISLAKDLCDLFKLGGFDLVKWSSNSLDVLGSLPDSSRAQIEFTDGSSLKILGMKWIPTSDKFLFTTSDINRNCTKRIMLSVIARFFDVLGLVAPVLLYAKILLQELWLAKVDWDEKPPEDIANKFRQITEELPLLSSINIPRHVGVKNGAVVSILGFGDASTKAYGGVIYLRVEDPEGNVSVRLVCAKSKVAPLKTISLARLELCASLILAQLIDTVKSAFQSRYPIAQTYAFTDSSIVLAWVKSSPHRFKTFVANRVTKIQELVSADSFYHIPGEHNPSDCLSRGLVPSQIVDHPLWWQGPPWASKPFSFWPIRPFVSFCEGEPLELKNIGTVTAATFESEAESESCLLLLADRTSSWSKLLRTVVYIYRFLKVIPSTSFISASDLEFAESKLMRALQAKYFLEDIGKINMGKACSRRLQRLKPFIENGIVRVGGRLEHAHIPFDRRHPIILPKKDHVVDLIIDFYHKKHCHAGPDLMLSIIRQKFWVLSARNAIRSRVHRCLPCFKFKPKPTFPEMADLKACRVIENLKPFVHVATDYAGPFKVSIKRGRGSRPDKAYVCLFVCLTTRALHVELASELSTPCFLAAFKRFLARRGAVAHVYSDQGTNYVGAKNVLDDLHKLLECNEFKYEFSCMASENRITWHLNPPAAPHFNGMAESAVKSVKTHLFRVVGEQILSFEEMNTLLAQIEAVLNTRPLCTTLTSDPSEPGALTPAHFLTMSPLKTIPAVEITENRLHLLSRYSLVDKLVQSFWKRWKEEYLHSLQIREKWCTPSKPVTVGTIVILNSDNVPVLHWPLGVIEEVFEGSDGVVRAARVRTSTGSYMRPVVRLCPLPCQ